MNYLEIVKRVNDITGFQGTIKSVDVSGYQAVITDAVKDAYEDIQRYRADWEFIKASKSVNVSNLKTEYTLQDLWGSDTPDLAEYRYIIYNHKRLVFIPHDEYVLIDYSNYEGREPREFSIEPATKSLLINPLDTNYVCQVHYTKTLDLLTRTTQVPIIPTKFHQLIVYLAVAKVAIYTGNISMRDDYMTASDTLYGQLMRAENPAKVVRKRPVA